MRGSVAPFLTWTRTLGVAFSLLLAMSALSRGEVQPAGGTGAKSARDPFGEGAVSLQLVSGALFSLRNLPTDSPTLHYAQTNLRLGWMLTSPDIREGPFPGNWEFLAEVSNSVVFYGFGHYLGGFTGLLRYNFVRPKRTVIPYVQGGVGIVYTDAYKDQTQRAIGQAIEFTPQLSLGLHYRIFENWAVDLEGMFHHISNAGMAKRNTGINALGGFLGLTCYF